jgi:branched-subunit amino acid aminotransferase/4-amino-4-deoxychorismate lyase
MNAGRQGLAARGIRMPAHALWIDGRLCRGAEATLSLFDRGARDGEGLFETLRVEAGVPLQWERHLERLVLSAAELGFPVPTSPARLREGLAELLESETLRDAVARVTITRGIPGGRPTRSSGWIEIESLNARLWSGTRRGSASAVVSRTPFAPGALGRHKTTSRLAYSLAREEARAAKVDEALLASESGELLEGAVTNVFIVSGERVVTPPLSAGILPGIAREAVIASCRRLGVPIHEAAISREQWLGADEIFVTNCVQQLVPLATLDGRPVARTRLAERLRDDYRAALAGA